MKKTIIIIDGNYIGHTCRFTNSIYHKGQETGVVYALLDRVLDLAEAYSTNNIVFAWDSKHSYRKKYFADYKSKRKARRQEMSQEEKELLYAMYRQNEFLQRLLPTLGFSNNLMQNGLEGDDIIAMVCRNYPDQKIVIVANDGDLFQLLSYNVSILTPKGEYLGKEYKQKNFEEDFGIKPDQWHVVKALAGCTSDEVPGIRSIGEKTACKFLLGGLKEKSMAYQKIVSDEGEKIKEFNIPLVKLPHEKTKPILLKENCFCWKEFESMCKQFSFTAFLNDRRDEWERFFEVGKDKK